MTTNIISASNAFATIVAKAALGRLSSNLVLAQLVNRDFENEVQTYGKVVSIQKRGALTVNDKTAGNPYTLQAVSDTAVTITLDKQPETTFLIEDYDRALARPDVLQGYLDDAVIALSERVESDIAALYTGFSGAVIATGASSPLVKANYIAAYKALSVAKAPQSNRYAVLHPNGVAEAFAITELANRDYRAQNENPALASGSLPPFLGFSQFESQNIKEVTSVQRNMFFHRDAMALVMRPLPAPKASAVDYAVIEQNGITIRVQISYSHKDGGHLVTVDALYGVATLRPEFGVVVSTD